MGFHAIDFLSDQPKNYIFRKTSNKTNLGGILSLLYLLVFLIIALSYFVFYALKDDYSIEYLQNEKIINQKEFENYYYDPKYNPKFEFNLLLFQEYNREKYRVEERYHLFDKTFDDNDNPLKNDSGSFNKSVRSFEFSILYDCLDKNNTNCDVDRDYTLSNEIKLNFLYHGFILDHQNKSAPLYINTKTYYRHEAGFKYDYPMKYRYRWNIIKYEEEKGFFSIFDGFHEENEDYRKEIGASIKGKETHNLAEEYGEQNLFVVVSDSNTNEKHFYKIIGEIEFYFDYEHYE